MARHRIIIAFLLTIIGLTLFYRIIRPKIAVSVYSTHKDVLQNTNFVNLVPNLSDDRLFVLEPYVLGQALGAEQLVDLEWRFKLPKISFSNHTFTLAMFGHQQASFIDREDVKEVTRVEGNIPFSNQTDLLHLFIRWHDLNVHIVVLHHVKHFLWIGKIPQPQLAQLLDFNVHFGKYEEIYDPFRLNRLGTVQFPDEIYHFVSQMSTSRYIHCPTERISWLAKNNVSLSNSKLVSSEEAIIGTKSLMKTLRMHFWMVCGTLLGWHRQCQITPYTTDTDFATWGQYLQGTSITEQLRVEAPKHNLHLYYSLGEPTHTQEFSFITTAYYEKVDMFFIYPNKTHYLLPYHILAKHSYAHSIYPKYELCSAELLGYKLLAPCDPEPVIRAEYGANWRAPLSNWSFSNSPHNNGPQIKYTFDGPQVEEFSPVLPKLISIFLVTIVLSVIYLFLTKNWPRAYKRLTQ